MAGVPLPKFAPDSERPLTPPPAPARPAPLAEVHGRADYVPYDKRKLSYAATFNNRWQSLIIRTMEWMTGKITLLRKIRAFEREGVTEGQGFWAPALRHMGVEIRTPQDQIDLIPPTGPLVIVANHPHGLVDGMVLAELVGSVREDYKILTRSLLTGVAEVQEFMIPVPFPHEEGALEKNLDMRNQTMAHLDNGGCVVLFPSGVVAASETWFGPAIEAEWNPFTAKIIRRSGARVLPIFFSGQNSRAYQIANCVSPVLRQGLLLREVVNSLNKPQSPVIGAPIDQAEIENWAANPRGFMAWLRERTLSLGDAR